MKYVWEDLPRSTNCFTTRSATMRNLNTGEIVQSYAANTKLVVVQKCVTGKGTYYRTYSAKHHNLNWAFEASALGLPNEKAPSAPSSTKSIPYSLSKNKPKTRTPSPAKKQKPTQKPKVVKGGEQPKAVPFWKRWFRKNS